MTRIVENGKVWTGKQLRRRCTPRLKNADPERSRKMKEYWAGPRGEAERAKRKANPEKYYRRGVPDGMKKPQAMRLWKKARKQAKQIMTVLEKRGDVPTVVVPNSEEDKAKRALEEAMAIALSPLTHSPTKVAALRLVLDFTKSKPTQKQEMTINSAEEWLKTVLDEPTKPVLIEGSASEVSD